MPNKTTLVFYWAHNSLEIIKISWSYWFPFLTVVIYIHGRPTHITPQHDAVSGLSAGKLKNVPYYLVVRINKIFSVTFE